MHVSIAQQIVEQLAGAATETTVADVRIGLGYTAVMLADGSTGVAFTMRSTAHAGCSVFRGKRPLCGRPAADLLPLLRSEEAIEAGVGLACANALANGAPEGTLAGDVLTHLELRPTDDVAMVGHLGPLVQPLRARARSLTILERGSALSGDLLPTAQAPAVLARCQVALITATSIINHSVDGLLQAARGCREVALLGASTPLLPGLFDVAGVTVLSGVIVCHPRETLQVVSEGGGMRQFRPHVRKVSLRRPAP